MHIAAKVGDESVIKLLLDRETEEKDILMMIDNEGNTPLHNAVRNDHSSVVGILMEKDLASLLHINAVGQSPLSIAIDSSLIDIACGIIGKFPGSLKHIEPNYILTNIFHGAILRKDFDFMIKLLNAKKEIINMLDTHQRNSLHYAVTSGDVGMTQFLLKEKVSLACQGDCDGQTPLHLAIKNGQLEVLEIILKYWSDAIDMLDKNHRNILHLVAASGHVEMARCILTKRVSLVYQGDCDGQTPLHLTVKDGLLEVLETMLDYCPDAIDMLDNNHHNILHLVAASSHVEMALCILTKKVLLAYQGDCDGQTPLHVAVKNGHLKVLKTILDYCPDAIDVLDKSHHHILHIAALCGNLDIVSFIIKTSEMENLINSPDGDGNTPLHLASMFLHFDVVKILLRNDKVNIKLINHKQQTALEVVDTSTDRGKDVQKEYIQTTLEVADTSADPGNDIEKLFDQKVAELEAASRNAGGDSDRDLTMNTEYQELIKAIQCGDLRTIDKFSKSKKDLLRETSPEGNTVLHVAARYANWLVVDAFLDLNDQNSYIDKVNHKGETPLHIAAKYGNVVVVFSLVDHDKKRMKDKLLKMRDNEGNTPLHNAIRHGHQIIADDLMDYDEDPILYSNNVGQSPLSIAIDARLYYISRLIIRRVPASLDHRGPEHLTLLHSVVIKQDYGIMVEILTCKKELIYVLDKKQRNPLHYAAASGHVKMVRRLCQEDASLVYQPDCNGQRPLHLAAKNGRPNVLKMLLKDYPDAIELIDNKNQNILHVAAQNGNVNIVSFIIKLPEMEDLVNSADKDGNTPLHLAAKEFHSDVVYILSTYMNVNIRVSNKENRTALQIVEMSKVKGKDIQKHLTIKALKAAYADRAVDAEDILEHRRFVRIEDKDGEGGIGKEMAQTLSVMNTLIATFTFTAAFTIPGGFRSDGPHQGVAVLVRRTSFRAFVITDTIAMTSSMTAAVIVFWSFWCSKSENFMDSLPMAIALTWIGLVSMTLAFVTGLYVVLSENMALAIAVSSIGCALPLIFYVLAPFISFLYGRSADANHPFAYSFSMVKIFLKKPIGWCFRCISIRDYLSAKFGFAILFAYKLIFGFFYYLIREILIEISNRCFGRFMSKRNDQLPK